MKIKGQNLNCTCDGNFNRKKFLKIETPEKVSKVNYVKGRLNGLAIGNIEIVILDIIDHDTVINVFASRNTRRSFFREGLKYLR